MESSCEPCCGTGLLSTCWRGITPEQRDTELSTVATKVSQLQNVEWIAPGSGEGWQAMHLQQRRQGEEFY